MKVIIGCDHGGFELKEALLAHLEQQGVELQDVGCFSRESVDYPDYAHKVASAVAQGEFDRGLLVCGTGLGMSMAANKHPGVRAALCSEPLSAAMSRAHNDANVLCLGGRVVGTGLAEEIVLAFLTAKFQGGRHARRVEKIELK